MESSLLDNCLADNPVRSLAGMHTHQELELVVHTIALGNGWHTGFVGYCTDPGNMGG
jgi:hypothetical protein